MNKKVGRNDPCPCGSGKKYKSCCYGKEEKKTYTATGKRKFKASVLSVGDKSQAIFQGQTPSSHISTELTTPQFKATKSDYRISKISANEPSKNKKLEAQETAPAELPPEKFEMTQEDYRKKESD